MDLKLPPDVATKQQLSILMYEIEDFIDAATQAQVRSRETDKEIPAPKPGFMFKKFLEANQVEITMGNLAKLLKELGSLKEKAPTIRFIFASEPSSEILTKLAQWIRSNSHLPVLIHVGVQPQIAVGCIVETPSRRYDFSLRQKLSESNALLEALKNG
ncbi:hypothetical protein DYH10_03140 [Candidatus Saccharibacteria bacterium CPR2]|nr:hypothetical protein [Candidatus Saccharibacteria bacterium CPR2]